MNPLIILLGLGGLGSLVYLFSGQLKGVSNKTPSNNTSADKTTSYSPTGEDNPNGVFDTSSAMPPSPDTDQLKTIVIKDNSNLLEKWNKVGGYGAVPDKNGNMPWISGNGVLWWGTDSNAEYNTAKQQLKTANLI